MHQNELKKVWYKTCMDQNSGTAKCQQHFKGSVIWSAEFNMIKNDSHCIISQPSHTQQTLKKKLMTPLIQGNFQYGIGNSISVSRVSFWLYFY